jgi:hypothetical protein
MDFILALQHSMKQTKQSFGVKGNSDVWFSLNPFLSKGRVLSKGQSERFGKKIISSIAFSWTIAGIGAFMSIKGERNYGLELFISIPVILSYIYILYIYMQVKKHSNSVIFESNPILVMSKNLANELSKKQLVRLFLFIGLFVLLLSLGAVYILINKDFLISFIIFPVAILSLHPLVLLFLAIKNQRGRSC